MAEKICFLQVVDGSADDVNNLLRMLHQVSRNSDFRFVVGRKPIVSVSKEELEDLLKNVLGK